MNNNTNTVYVGMDVHKESFSLCCYTFEDDRYAHHQKMDPDFSMVVNYINAMKKAYGEDTQFVCGYEAGCLGYTLYHQLNDNGITCVILAPSTMHKSSSNKKKKNDKRDSELIAHCLATNAYKPVFVPTDQDTEVKEYLRMREDHVLKLKTTKQQILAFCLRYGCKYDGSNWTKKHLNFLKDFKMSDLMREILDEYLLTYEYLDDKIQRIDKKVEELAELPHFKENVDKLVCIKGIKTYTAMTVLSEIGDFNRFPSADHFAGYIGLIPGEHSSSDNINKLGITKAGNTHVRRVLVEATQGYVHGAVGYKSIELKKRQEGKDPKVVQYADKCNERLKRRYNHLAYNKGKQTNVAKTAIAREMSCFIWGMVTGDFDLSSKSESPVSIPNDDGVSMIRTSESPAESEVM